MRLRKFTEVRNLAIFACAVLACLFAPTAVRNSAERAFEGVPRSDRRNSVATERFGEVLELVVAL